MKLIAQLFALLVALVLLALGVAAIALPRLVNTEEFRAALHESAAEALGTPVEWTSLDAGVVPLRLTIESPVLVAKEGQREDARLSADAIELRLSVLALLDRRVEVESLVLSGAELVVTRTPDGFVLPVVSGEAADPTAEAEAAVGPPDEAPAETSGPGEAGEELSLAIRRFAIADGRLVVRDRTLERPVDWSFDALSVEATGESLERPLALEVASRVTANGTDVGGVEIRGDVLVAGIYDLALSLDAFRIGALQPYVTDATLDGLLSGSISLEGATDVVSRVETDLVLDEMDVRTFGLDLEGRLELVSQQERDEPVDFEAKLDLGAGGRAAIEGQVTLAGATSAKIALDGLELAPFASLAGPDLDVSGRATGEVELVTAETGGITRLRTDLDVAGARYVDPSLALGGELDLVLSLRGLGETDPVLFDVAMDFMEGGGRIDAEGTATLAGAVDAKLVFGNVDLAPLAPWIPEGTTVAGRLTGDADVAVTAARVVERAKARLSIADARVVRDPLDVAGRFDFDVTLEDEGPIRIASTLALADQSRVVLEGTSTVDGVVDLTADVERFDLAIAQSFLPDPETKLAGRATGKARLVGDASAPEFVSIDLGVEGGLYETPDYGMSGPLIAVAKLKEPLSRPRGRVDIDLTAASLRYTETFAKPAGMRAELVTRFVPEESGETVFEGRLALRDVDEILLQGAVGETTSIAVTTTNVDLKGWEDVLPVLAPYSPDGIVAFEGLGVELVDGAPSRFGGRIALRGVGLRVPEAGEVRLRGTILGEETRIRTKGLRARIGGATIGIKGTIDDPLGEGRFDLGVATQGEAEVNDLLSQLTTTRDVVFGPLQFDSRLTGRLGGDGEVTDSLEGRTRFSVGERGGGRLRGVSILRTVLDQIPLLGGAARLTRPFRGGRSVDDYFTERFEMIEGDFVVGDGQVEAETLRLAYPGYEARLQGPMRLRDLKIDMEGELLLKADLVSAIGGLAGADVGDREPIRIQLARVTNTLDDPKVEMTAETLASIPKLLFQGIGLDTITLGIGKGIGKALERALEGR